MATRFTEVVADHGGLDIRFVASRTAGGIAVFRSSMAPVSNVGASTRVIRFGSQSRATGTRSGNMSFRGPFGQLSAVKNAFVVHRDHLLTNMDNESCISVYERRHMVRLTREQTLDAIGSLSCGLLGIWLRFNRDRLTRLVCDLIREPYRQPGTFRGQVTNPIRASGNRFLWNMVATVAGNREIDSHVYWDTHLGDALREVDLLAVAVRFNIDIVVVQTGLVSDFANLVSDGKVLAGVVPDADLQAFSRVRRDMRGLILISGKKDAADVTFPHPKNHPGSGSTCIFRCSYLSDRDSHFDIVTCPHLEAAFTSKRYVRWTFFAKYTRDDNPRSAEGYFDKSISQLSPQSHMDARRVLYDVTKAHRPLHKLVSFGSSRYRFINTWEDYKSAVADLIRAVDFVLTMLPIDGAAMPNGPLKIGGMDESLPGEHIQTAKMFGTTLFLDTKLVREISQMHMGREETNTVGMVYILQDLFKAIKDAGFGEHAAITNFSPMFSSQRARTMFDRNATGRPQLMHRISDVFQFSIDMVSPRVQHTGKDNCAVVLNQIVGARLYDKELYEMGMRMAFSPWGGRLIQIATEERYPPDTPRERIRRPDMVKFALRLSKTSLLMQYFLFRPPTERFRFPVPRRNLTKALTRTFATHVPLGLEMLYVFDPQIDEPVVPRARDKGHNGIEKDRWEIDVNMCYAQIFAGMGDRILQLDIYGQRYFEDAPRRPMPHVLDFDNGDFLRGYQPDRGFSFVRDIDGTRLRVLFERDMRPTNSWLQFDARNKDRKDRMVPNSSIIHLTARLVKRTEVDPDIKFPGVDMDDRAAKWIFIQRDLLMLKFAFFHHSEDTRKGMHTTMSNMPHRSDPSTLLKGSWVEQPTGEPAYVKEARTAFKEFFQDMKDAGFSHREAYKFGKAQFVRAIGCMKNGLYSGGLEVRTSTDMINAQSRGSRNDDGMDEDDNEEDEPIRGRFEYNGLTLPMEASPQVHTRELPESDQALVQMFSVIPVILHNHARHFRINILERSRLFMDMIGSMFEAIEVKTDAVFFEDENLETVLGVLENEYSALFPGPIPTAEACREGRELCRDNECPHDKMCGVHNPWAALLCQYNGTVPSIGEMSPFKLIPRRGYQDHGNEVEMGVMFMQSMESRDTDRPSEIAINRRMSPNGLKVLMDFLHDAPPRIDRYAHEFVEEAVRNVAMPAPAQVFVAGEDRDRFDDWLRVHCGIVTGPLVRNFYLGGDDDQDDALLHRVNRESYRRELCTWVHREIRAALDRRGGVLLEGPPGTGKSYAVCSFIRECIDPETECAFVVTSTHMTLKPYMELTGENQSVSTIHAFLGTFNKIEEVAMDVRKHLTGDKSSRYKSRFMRFLEKNKNRLQTIYLFVDEFEMLPMCCEEILHSLATWQSRFNIKMILLGDRKQTAAYGAGVRCDGSAILAVTKNQTIHCDLQQRNADYEYVKAQMEASNGKPSMYLEPPLSDYSVQRNMDDGNANGLSYNEVCAHAMERWMQMGEMDGGEGQLYTDPVISCQNYKAIVVTTFRILAAGAALFTRQPGERVFAFVGDNSFTRTEMSNRGMEPNENDDDEGAREMAETSRAKFLAEDQYRKRSVHTKERDGNPSGKLFLTGTKMLYRKGHSYQAVTAFVPAVQVNTGDVLGKQGTVAISTVFRMLEPIQMYRGVTVGGKRETRKDFEGAKFVDGAGNRFIFKLSEMRAHLYYPFAMYTSATVGLSFNEYYMVQFCNESSVFSGNDAYISYAKALVDIERVMGETSWQTPIVKTMNVITSRVRQGNRVKIIEIKCGGSTFWHRTVFGSPWHFATLDQRQATVQYKERLTEWRNVVVEAKQKVGYNSRV
jgi:hypothetical protein